MLLSISSEVKNIVYTARYLVKM